MNKPRQVLCASCHERPAMLSQIKESRKPKCAPCHRAVGKTHRIRCLNPKCPVKIFCGVKGQKYCTYKCYHASLCIGGFINSSGYKIIRVNGKPTPEHRHVAEEILGRSLTPNETIHHKNGKRADNHPDNLELRAGKHRQGQRVRDLIEDALAHLRVYKPEVLAHKFRKANHE
jgi:HNH endonuclease